MKKIVTNYRYYIMAFLGLVAMLGIFAVPANNLPAKDWIYVLVSSKVIGIGAGWILARLVKRWEAKGTIPEITKLYNEF